MPQHHLDELSHSLAQKGWTVVKTRSLTDFPYDCNAWSIKRGDVEFDIEFDRFDGMGQDVSIIESSGCSVRNSVHLYFGKWKRWLEELPVFISQLDDLA